MPTPCRNAPRTTPGRAGLMPRGRRGCCPLLVATCSIESALQRLELDELLQAEWASLTAEPRLFVAPERRLGVERSAIDVDLPRPQPSSHPLGASGIAAPHRASKPVRRSVRNLD